MKKITLPIFAIATVMTLVAFLSLPAQAQSASEALYKSKCVSCHAADGSGSAVGKKLGAHDIHSPEIQKMSDAELVDLTTTGKNKMPGYGKSLKPDEIKGLVAYMRSLTPAK
jgi:cytochrome c6